MWPNKEADGQIRHYHGRKLIFQFVLNWKKARESCQCEWKSRGGGGGRKTVSFLPLWSFVFQLGQRELYFFLPAKERREIWYIPDITIKDWADLHQVRIGSFSLKDCMNLLHHFLFDSHIFHIFPDNGCWYIYPLSDIIWKMDILLKFTSFLQHDTLQMSWN